MPEAISSSAPMPGPARRASLAVAECAAMLAAALGCLQPAIDPVFLTLLSSASGVPMAAHGLIVATTQAGAALGSLGIWRFGHRLSARVVPGVASLAVVASLLTPEAGSLALLLALRGLYGAAMGMVFAHAMARCAARRPSSAYAGMFLLQLLLATLVSSALPALAEARGPAAALAVLALAPALAASALLACGDDHARGAMAQVPRAMERVPAAGWALAGATFAAITATMLVWSFSGALAAAAEIGERTIGQAVALGSLVGAITAIAVMRERVVVPLPLTALIGAGLIASPLIMTTPGAGLAFTTAIIALNIGSTALIVRCSALASAASHDSRFRAFVACTHSMGMIAGPLIGSALVAGIGRGALFAGAIGILACVIAAAVTASRLSTGPAFGHENVLSTGSIKNGRQTA